MAVYDTDAVGATKLVDPPSDKIRTEGVWLPRETAILQDLPQDSLVVEVGPSRPLNPPTAPHGCRRR